MDGNIKRWRRFLEGLEPEVGTKTLKDYKFIVRKSPSKIEIDILDKNTKERPKGKQNQYGDPSGIAHMSLAKRGEQGSWEVASVASPAGSRGVGKELYLLALELAADDGLSPDSVNISKPARNMWMNTLKAHPAVSFREKESERDTDVEDPFKYLWTISPTFKSEILHRPETEKEKLEEPEEKEEKWVIDPFDPAAEDIDDYLEDVYENQQPAKDSNRVTKVIIFDENNKILILKRADGDENWDLPGGHVEKGEKWEDGARRETKEETDLDVSRLKHLSDHEEIKFYTCKKPDGGVSLQKEEHTDFKWVNPKEVDNIQMRKHQKDAILAADPPIKEDFQQNVKKGYSKLKFKLIGQGKNKYNIGGQMKKPSYKRSKSAPPGFGGALEEKNE